MPSVRAIPLVGKASSLLIKQTSRGTADSLLRHISSTASSIGSSSANFAAVDTHVMPDRNSAATTAASTPFYGSPRPPPRKKEKRYQSRLGRIGLLAQHATTALLDPTRADAVAAVGELTGSLALEDLRRAMQNHAVGRRLLQERPLVSKQNIPHERLLSEAQAIVDSGGMNLDHTTINPNDITFGQAYGLYMLKNWFDPDSRDQIRYIDDPELAYIMLRYRQCHDFWHALTDLPPTVLGELGLKWLELFQTGLPSAALSSSVASFSLSLEEQKILWSVYLPWALRVGQQRMAFGTLMNIHYEEEWDTNLQELRDRYQIEPAPYYNPDDEAIREK
jgi:ubiquinone biosynthesis protein COQ4